MPACDEIQPNASGSVYGNSMVNKHCVAPRSTPESNRMGWASRNNCMVIKQLVIHSALHQIIISSREKMNKSLKQKEKIVLSFFSKLGFLRLIVMKICVFTCKSKSFNFLW